MVAQIIKNDKSEIKHQTIIQVNRKIKTPNASSSSSSSKSAKDECGRLVAQHNKIENWETVNAGIKELIKFISGGYAVRFGIKEGGNSIGNVSACYGLALDFDKDWKESDTLGDEFFQKYACLWYRTPSWSAENEKHRVVFLFDKPISPEEYRTIYQYLRVRYPDADKTNDPGRLFYGSRGLAGWVFIINPTNILSTDSILSEISDNQEPRLSIPIAPEKVSIETPEESLTTKFLDYLNEQLFQGIYKGDLAALYSLHDSNQSWTAREAETGELGRLQGANPFSTTNSTGNSFLVISKDGAMPFFWDKSASLGRKMLRNCGQKMNHGSYLDYYFHVRQHRFGDFQGITYDADTGLFPKGFFFTLCTHLCDTFKIARFDFGIAQTVHGCFRNVLESFDGQLFVQGWNMTGDTMYIIFDSDDGVWLPISRINLMSQFLLPRLESLHPDAHELLAVWSESVGRKSIPKMSSFFAEYVQDKFRKKKNTFPTERHDLIPMANGVWNTSTHLLEPNSGQCFNFQPSIPISHNYYDVIDDHPAIVNLKSYYHDWLRSDIQGELLLAYQILCVQRQAYRLRKMIILMGDSTKGKSTYASLVSDVMRGKNLKHPYARKYKASSLFGTSDHSSAAIEGSYLIYIDEMNNLNKYNNSVEDLKLYVAEEKDRVININPKFEKQRDIVSYAALIGTSEDILQVATSDGLDKRIVYIRVDESTNMTMKDRLNHLRESDEIIHNWCLQQESEYWYKRFLELSNHMEIQHNLIEKKRESEPLIEFLETYVLVTDEPSDIVQTDQLWRLFKYWRNTERINRDFGDKASFGRCLSKILKESKYGMNWHGGSISKPRGYTHLDITSVGRSILPSVGF
jgi:hypothetical protein